MRFFGYGSSFEFNVILRDYKYIIGMNGRRAMRISERNDSDYKSGKYTNLVTHSFSSVVAWYASDNVERFRIENPVQAPTVTNEQPNKKINIINTVVESFKSSNIILKPKAVNNNLNIYNLYSNSNVRPMHKLHAHKLTAVQNI